MICKNCGEGFTPKHGNQKYCSGICRINSQYQYQCKPKVATTITCAACRKTFITEHWGVAPKYCSQPCKDRGARALADARHERTCKQCGKVFHRKPRERNKAEYCSRGCAFGAKRAKPASSKVYFTTCRACGGTFTARRINSLVCSPACQRDDARARHMKKHQAVPAHTGECVECGTEFTSQGRGRRAKYCSRSCCKRSGKRNRRVQERLKSRSNVKLIHLNGIWDRDNGKCQLCMQMVVRNGHGKAPHPFGHSIDHRQPIAFGGEHTPANVQLTHFICNSWKGESLRDVPRSDYRAHLNDRLFSIINGEDERWRYVSENKGIGGRVILGQPPV